MQEVQVPITITYDIQGAPPTDHHRLQSMFERLGWEQLGGTVFRYPHTRQQKAAELSSSPRERSLTSRGAPRRRGYQVAEDWLNDVVPALMILRAYIIHAQGEGRTESKFTIDAHACTGCSPETGYGNPPLPRSELDFNPYKRKDFGEEKLQALIDEFVWPY